MEAPEGSESPGGKRGPMTSTPKEHHPPPGLPDRTDSATSLDSDNSGEDWLIKVCCPKARHRYRRYAQAKKPTKTGFSHLDKEEDFIALTEWMPITPYQVYPGVPRQESTDLEWLIRLRCPRAQMEQMRAERKQSLPAVSTPLSRSPSKAGRSLQPGGTKDSENWLKHFSIAQASSDPGPPASLCVLLPPFHPLFESSSSGSYFPSFLPPFPFSLLSVSPSTSPPIVVLPSVMLPPSVPAHFFHLLPPVPPFLHSPSLFFQSPFLQLTSSQPPSPSAALQLPAPPPAAASEPPSDASASELSLPAQQPPPSEHEPLRDFSAYHSHNPFFLPIPPPIQSYRRYQARQKNSDTTKYP
ncbi:uncharacterized protein LOC118082609 isoform X3 [Zootoca vivipara]|uniref:uncharacterized protein LOC118082609 isoform X3 n=1 Tax=Zootoca vivipara TaxID=8524 RepID=UPI0015918915|nr:uncharacterized protein LOC118082609 isoform X3 [Zootoca vivipara]